MSPQPGEIERAMKQNAAQIRARLWAPPARKRPDEPTPEQDARSEAVEEKIALPVFALMEHVVTVAAAVAPTTPSFGPTCRDICEQVATFYGVTAIDIMSDSKHARVVWPRHIAMHLAVRLCNRSMAEIGRRMGGKHHTSILHAIRKIEVYLQTNEALATELAELERRIGAREAPTVWPNHTTLPPPSRSASEGKPRFWTVERNAEFVRMWGEGITLRAMGDHFGRTFQSISDRARDLKLPPRARRYRRAA